jgi:GT2 family glycosyltransferase
MNPTVLVGIVTRNRADILPKAIESALAQSGATVRVAVIDNASTDATIDLGRNFPTVEWTRWQSNRGYMAARNHWMTSALENYFVSLDDDAWFVQGDELAVATDVLERDPNVAAVAFDILSPDRPRPTPREKPHRAAMFIGCGHVLRLDAIRAVGAYDSVPGNYGGEEKDLCLRLMDAGYKIVRVPGVHVWHDKTSASRDLPAQHRSGVCNDLVMTLRRTPAALLPLALAAKFYRHSIFSLRNGLTRPCLQGFKLFARSSPALLRSRRPVRTATLRAFMRLSGT